MTCSVLFTESFAVSADGADAAGSTHEVFSGAAVGKLLTQVIQRSRPLG
jgi:hypothetical protein